MGEGEGEGMTAGRGEGDERGGWNGAGVSWSREVLGFEGGIELVRWVTRRSCSRSLVCLGRISD